MSLSSLGIIEAITLLQSGKSSAVELTADCLKRIGEFDPSIHAWAQLNPDHALKQARSCDTQRRKGKPCPRLHGIPVALKDIIDTALVPTECGSALFAGNLPKQDAFVSARLKQYGAIIMGKTVTAELASFTPGETRNPHNTDHTPGGSSSGSAAAVASFMVPASIGTQTNGSVIRPASFCGVVGFKPSYGLVPRSGILTQSPFLDQVGVFTRSVEDAALLAELLIGADPQDNATLLTSISPPLLDIACHQPPLPPKFALVKTPAWHKANPDTQAGLEQVVELLGEQARVVELPGEFEQVWQYLQTVNEAEMAYHYGRIYKSGRKIISAGLVEQIERGQQITALEYMHAKQQRLKLRKILDDIFHTFDALITPSAPGEAPKGLESTGDPVFCSPWSFCGVPAISLPLLQGESGLPIGVQLVGQYNDDGRLLRSGRWLTQYLEQNTGTDK